MNQTEVSPLANGLLMTHKVITRGLTVSLRKCDEYLGNKGLPPGEAGGFSTYISTLKNVTHAHHLSEDEIAFPHFKDYFEAPFSRLKTDHQSIAQVLDRISNYVSGLTTERIAGLKDVLNEFEVIWAPHIQIEQENFSAEKVNKVVPMSEQVMMVKKLGDHGQKNAGPGPLAVPFMFYNLEGSDRDIFMKPFPLIVRKLLVPVIWKGQWKSMKPFLLKS